jgi:hypothetical protein
MFLAQHHLSLIILVEGGITIMKRIVTAFVRIQSQK